MSEDQKKQLQQNMFFARTQATIGKPKELFFANAPMRILITD